MQALLDEDDDLYHAISVKHESLDNSTLNMSIPNSPEVS